MVHPLGFLCLWLLQKYKQKKLKEKKTKINITRKRNTKQDFYGKTIFSSSPGNNPQID